MIINLVQNMITLDIFLGFESKNFLQLKVQCIFIEYS